jgi:hypothetical protein
VFKIGVGDELMGILGEKRSTGEKHLYQWPFVYNTSRGQIWKCPRASAVRNRILFDHVLALCTGLPFIYGVTIKVNYEPPPIFNTSNTSRFGPSAWFADSSHADIHGLLQYN